LFKISLLKLNKLDDEKKINIKDIKEIKIILNLEKYNTL